ncbi:MAG TPA: M1 family metallopeptidase [Gemmatimonadaceae bacterium]|nr:M1 family metallopeptidase [Gemmatimonadaceae bacterium]
MKRLAAASIVSVLCASAVGAQSPRPYRPAFDVRDYAITIDLPDTGSTIAVNDAITVARVERADTLVLDLLDLTVNRVTVNGTPVKFVQTPAEVHVPLPPRPERRAFDVVVSYGGAVKDGLIVRTDSAGRWTYFGDNWPNRGRHWIASIDHPSDKATVTWRVRAPASETVVANGKLVGQKAVRDAEGRDRTEWTWRETQPIPVYLMVIAAAPLTRYDLGDTDCGLAALQRCVPQYVYTAPEQANFAPGPFARAGEIVQLFSSLIGPFPYEKLAHLQSSTRFGGMENASEIFYADNTFRRGTMNDDLIAHETAHQWFGDAVTERDWPHLWLSEGFATYFAALWDRAARGDSAFRVTMARIRRTVLADTMAVTKRPVIDTIETNLLALLDRNSYEKGGFVLHMLKAQVGEGAFFDALRHYYAAHHNATAVTDDLEQAMERASGQKLDWFFNQWLRRPGYPEITAAWSYDAAAHEVVVDVTQGGPFGAYRAPLTIAAIDSSGVAHRTTIQLSDASSAPVEARIPLATAPASVVLDPDVVLLARFTVAPR